MAKSISVKTLSTFPKVKPVDVEKLAEDNAQEIYPTGEDVTPCDHVANSHLKPAYREGFKDGWTSRREHFENKNKEIESLKISNEINRTAAENGNRIANEALERAKHPDETIKREREELKAYQAEQLAKKDARIVELTKALQLTQDPEWYLKIKPEIGEDGKMKLGVLKSWGEIKHELGKSLEVKHG